MNGPEADAVLAAAAEAVAVAAELIEDEACAQLRAATPAVRAGLNALAERVEWCNANGVELSAGDREVLGWVFELCERLRLVLEEIGR